MKNPLSLALGAKICLLRLSAIGDVCHAAAMVTRIRQYRPDVEITWVIGKIEYQLMKGMDGVRFVVFDKKAGLDGVKSVRAELKGQVFDVLCVMQVALRANILSRVIKAKVRLGFDKSRSKEGHSLFINKCIKAQHFPHVLEGFMGFADAMGIPKDDTINWTMPLSQDDETLGVNLKKEVGQYVIISPAASKKERNWLAERYAELTDYLSEQKFAVILCGGPGALDKALESEISARSENVHRSYVGQTTLKQQLGLIKHAALVIAPDTGPAHMASTVGTPVIGLYAHSNPVRTGPYLDLHRIVSVYPQSVKSQYGKDWQSMPYGTRVKGDTLMAQIKLNDVIGQIDAWVQSTRS